MTTLDPEQTAALYRAANRRELGEYVGELLGEVERERVERAARDQRRYDSIAASLHTAVLRAEAAERELAEARRRLAAVEVLVSEWEHVPTDGACPDNMCGVCTLGNVAALLRAALTPDADA